MGGIEKNGNDNIKEVQKGRKASSNEFLCKVRFLNQLPDIPFDPKLLRYPLEDERFFRYSTSTLEKNYKWQMHTESDYGVPLDLIDPINYGKLLTPSPIADPADLKLLEPLESIESSIDIAIQKKSRKEGYRTPVFWLHKTKYISQDSEIRTRERVAVDDSVSSQLVEGKTEQKREEQLRSIEATFEAAKIPPKRAESKLRPMEVLPVFPDFDRWTNVYTQVNFDSDDPKVSAEWTERKLKAIIKGFGTGAEEGKKIVALLSPSKKRKLSVVSETESKDQQNEISYDWLGEYSYQTDSGKSNFSGSYFFNVMSDTVYYKEINSKVTLRKLSAKERENLLIPSSVIGIRTEISEQQRIYQEEKQRELLEQTCVSDNLVDVDGDEDKNNLEDEIKEDEDVWMINEQDKS